MLITRAEVEGVAPLAVRLANGRIEAIGRDVAPLAGEERLDAAGGALLPGLHDHHLHLFALAAAEESVRCGPPHVNGAEQLAVALRRAPGGDWIRGVGYHESVAGQLDRDRLDALVADRPIRIQHRTGSAWLLNSRGLERLGIDAELGPPGVERDASGRATGRLFRLDGWLRERIGDAGWPSLADVSRRLASRGVTGVTDATASNSSAELREFVRAHDAGQLLQRLVVMGTPDLPDPAHGSIERGAVKLVLDERELPAMDVLAARIARAHEAGRSAAIHCVTLAELVLAAGALADAGARAGDRIEHASVCPPDAARLLAELPVAVVTQPGLVWERGDAYRSDVEPADRPWLYRLRGLLDANVPLGAGTDAPFGEPDPWRAMQAAVDRRTRDGALLGPDERLSPEQALGLFTSSATAPGSRPRRVEPGARADLCLLDRPWSQARRELSQSKVVATFRDGVEIFRAAADP